MKLNIMCTMRRTISERINTLISNGLNIISTRRLGRAEQDARICTERIIFFVQVKLYIVKTVF